MLTQLIQELHREEVRLFKLLMDRTESEKDRKTLRLFDLIRKSNPNEEMGTGEIVLELYGKDTPSMRNNLYGLRNRLLKELKRSLNFQHWDLDNKHRATHNLLLARQLRKQGHHVTARSLLESTLREAEKHDLFQIQDLVLEELLGLASTDLDLDVSQLIERREEAFQKQRLVQDSQNAFAYLNQHLRKTNFAGEDSEIIQVMEEVRNRLQRYQSIFNSPRGRIRIFNITSQILLKNEAFQQLETFLKSEFDFFQQEQIFNRNTHRTKVNMVAWLINVTFKNFKFEESIAYCALFRETLEEHSRRFFNQFLPNYYLSLANSHSCLGQTDEALGYLNKGMEEASTAGRAATSLYFHINFANTFYEQGDVPRALKELGRIYTLESYQQMDSLNQLYLHLFEIALRIEARDLEFAETRIQQIRKWHKRDLAQLPRKKAFLRILELIVEAEMFGKSIEKRPEHKVFSESAPEFVPGADEVIDHAIWLRAYRSGRSYAEVLGEVIQTERKRRQIISG